MSEWVSGGKNRAGQRDRGDGANKEREELMCPVDPENSWHHKQKSCDQALPPRKG